MKVIFVGVHNKPGKMPLCSSTKSGKLIDRIIEGVKPIECLKTNLYDVEYYPANQDKAKYALDWVDRIDVEIDDIIILLGAEVYNDFYKYLYRGIIKAAHPASKRSHAEMDKYVIDTIAKIKVESITSRS
jgi:hypothetical protein